MHEQLIMSCVVTFVAPFTSGGPVNKVFPGDELLEIQGVNVVGMRRLEAWTLIRRLAAGPVDVVLHRPPKPVET